MNYRKLGSSDIEVSEISLGCWTMGGLNWENGHSSGWANVDLEEIQAAVKTGIETGVNHFDNADVYGNGVAERRLAKVFESLGLKSEDYVFTSKVGYVQDDAPHAYQAENIRNQCEQSLANLKRDHLDIYYLHHDNFGKNDCYLAEAAETMQALKQEGKIRLIGQSAYRSSRFEKIVPVVQPTVLQSWAHAMDTKFVEPTSIVGQMLEKNHLSFVAFSPLNQGLLLDKSDATNPPAFESGDHRNGNPKFSASSLERLAPKLKELKKRFGGTTEDLSSVALRYVLNFPNVACVIPGFRNEAQVSCNLHAAERSLSPEDMIFIKGLFKK